MKLRAGCDKETIKDMDRRRSGCGQSTKVRREMTEQILNMCVDGNVK